MILRNFKDFRRTCFAVAGSFLACSFLGAGTLLAQPTADASSPVPRIVEQIDEHQLVVLKGNTRPEARPENDLGQVTSDFAMNNMILVLRRSTAQQAAFDAFVASQYESSSPNFHHWLAPDEVGERFGPASSDIAKITQWLESQGFRVNNVARNRLAIRFSGNARLVRSAFHTEIHTLQTGSERHIANMSDPQIPSALTPVVVGVQALHNFFAHPLHRLGSQVRRNDKTGQWERLAESTQKGVLHASEGVRPMFGTTGGSGSNTYPVEDIAPYDFAAIYNVAPLWNASTPIDGTGQRIAIVGSSNINLADVATFRSSFGLPPNVPTVVIPDSSSDPGACSDPSASNGCYQSQVENSLDVEWAGAVAKNASIILVASNPGTGSDFTSDPVYVSANYIIENQVAPIMNVSYGNCEAFLGTAGNAGFNTLWQTAASEGIAVFVATGDSGSPACDEGQSNTTPYPAQIGLSVSGLASTPYNTAVGGTDFNWGATAAPYWNATNDSNGATAIGYIPELPWNETCANPLVLANIKNIAQQTHLGTVTDSESACNFIYANYQTIYARYSVDLSFYVNVVGGGGGRSACTVNDYDPATGNVDLASCSGGYDKPSWQTSLTPGDGKRDIPDISFFASSGFLGSAYLICVSAPNYSRTCNYSASSEPTYQEVGGTSVASPIMAGIMALINQKTGVSQGNPNAELYALAASQNYAGCSSEAGSASGPSCIFHDVDLGTNAMPCLATSPDCNLNNPSDALGIIGGYSAVQGYDLATGLGSANVANLVNGFSTSANPTPAVTLTPSSLAFASTTVGTAAASQSVVVKNTGNAILNISSVSISGANSASFSETDNCQASLAVFGSCTITVTFNPTTTGSLSASLNIADNASASANQTVALSGIGSAPKFASITLSPASVIFLATAIGTVAAPQVVIVQNTGDAALTITNIGIGGLNPESFFDTHNCTSVAAGSTCNITVTFKPKQNSGVERVSQHHRQCFGFAPERASLGQRCSSSRYSWQLHSCRLRGNGDVGWQERNLNGDRDAREWIPWQRDPHLRTG
jgi:subtilase family serine protease